MLEMPDGSMAQFRISGANVEISLDQDEYTFTTYSGSTSVYTTSSTTLINLNAVVDGSTLNEMPKP